MGLGAGQVLGWVSQMPKHMRDCLVTVSQHRSTISLAVILVLPLAFLQAVPPRSPWQDVNVILGRATQDCRLEDRTYSSIGIIRCIIEKLEKSIDGDKLREPEPPTGGNYESPPKEGL